MTDKQPTLLTKHHLQMEKRSPNYDWANMPQNVRSYVLLWKFQVGLTHGEFANIWLLLCCRFNLWKKLFSRKKMKIQEEEDKEKKPQATMGMIFN